MSARDRRRQPGRQRRAQPECVQRVEVPKQRKKTHRPGIQAQEGQAYPPSIGEVSGVPATSLREGRWRGLKRRKAKRCDARRKENGKQNPKRRMHGRGLNDMFQAKAGCSQGNGAPAAPHAGGKKQTVKTRNLTAG
ncbi:hypothetical protein ABB37_00419 [Leptomonas pyrrhocoris]|uniref:Uncharacterized protein n=1 Tax=Leptomonas pyrrhocoris TaxID=157538 RepID=A0A0M9GAA0_LEPPY|nr:hypothetical protein ABB37_00419 [Leptomonas pyrrhocoris]KPA86170.1 hypothetical protein ABB37_00419 [Leptomonas pyrrhocoris]|eukprot:XP_015664609.1 hypothetical protein ABB37_00419 [Leptomonas pyrrhocoris]